MASAQEIQHILLLYLSAILLLIGVSTPAWRVDWNVSKITIKSGLFRHCIEDNCVDGNGDKTAKGMEIVGLFAAVFCAICMTVHHAMKNNSNNVTKTLPQVTFYSSIAGAALIFLGCAIYAYERFGNGIYPGYSFVLTLIGGIILIVGGAASSRK